MGNGPGGERASVKPPMTAGHAGALPVHVLDRDRRALTAGLLLVVSVVAFEAIGVATVLPATVADLGRLELYGWAFSAFMLASLVGTVAAGQLADERGPAVPFATGLVLLGSGLIVAGLAPSMPVLILARALQGGGAGAITATAYVAIGRGYPDALRARMLALLSTAWIIPGLIGPALAGLLAERLTWRLVFLGLLPLLPLAGALLLPALRQLAVEASVQPRHRRLGPALQLALGTGLMLAGLGLRAAVPAFALVVAGLALAVHALRRLMPPGTLTARAGLPAGLAVNALLNFSFFGAEAFLPLGLTALRGQTTAQAGVVLTAATLTWTAGSWTQARLDARDGGRGRRGRVASGVALVIAGVGVAGAAVLTDGPPMALAAAGWGIAGLGMGLAYPTITLIALRAAPAGQEGAVAGSLRVAELFAVAVGAGLGGAAVGLAAGLDWAVRAGLAAAFAIALIGGLVALLGTRRVLRPES